MSTGKIFTKLGASCAYWQIPIDYQSSKLLTFSTPFGRYRFLCMPYGISSASDVCQMYISQMLDGIEGSTNSQADITWGDDEHQLKQRTLEIFKVIRKSGMKLNKSKCSFHQPELIYLGHKITAEGVFLDESKIKAIKDMPYPKTIKELQRFLGSINYLGKFIPHLSDITKHLRELLKQNDIWSFKKHHKKEVEYLKRMITGTPYLKSLIQNCQPKYHVMLPVKG